MAPGINNSTGQTFSNVDSILKDFYLGPVREQLEYSSVLAYRIQKDSESVGGRKVVIPAHIGKNESFTGVSDGGYLPDPGAQSWDTMEFPVKYVYGRLLITGPTIAAAKTDKMAFLRTLDAAIKGLTRDVKKEMNRLYHGEGNGILGTTWTLPAGPTAARTTIPATELANTWASASTNKIPFIRPGMTIGMVPTAGASDSTKDSATAIAGFTVASVNPDATGATTMITVTGAGIDPGVTPGVADATSYYLVRAARMDSTYATTYAQTSWFKEPMGLKAIIDDGNPTAATTFQGLDVTAAANSWFRSTVNTTSTALNFSVMQQAFDAVAKKAEGRKPTLILTDYTQRRKYFELWGGTTPSDAAQRRYVETMTLDGGFDAVSYNGVPIVADVDATPKHMYFLYEPDLAMFMNEDFFWLDRDGKVLHRLEDKDAWQATLARYFEFGTYRRNTHYLLSNLDE